ncbi:MAG: hypothetical protein KDA92_23200, partial [Planctomycetales bacterium]|nr:hypothetical protein [Planctomycetales bacterium]
LPGIAGYRDLFYEQLIQQLAAWDSTHAKRLREESRRFRQPFGSARQHLNSQLTRHRASQLEHVRLASVFARMGYPEAAQKLINAVPVASARMICQIDCNLTLVQRLIHQSELDEARRRLRETRDTLLRGIECGAIVDPWNVIGFDGNFSLFPAMENSIHDHRVDELLGIVEEIFDGYGRLWSTASAVDNAAVNQSVSLEMEEFANWWHQFATHEMGSIDCSSPLDLYRAAKNVAEALGHWREAGEEKGAIRFWAPYVETFDSPKAYSMVITMLLERRDVVAARGLLIHWLGQAETVPLEQGEESFYRLATRWMVQTLELAADEDSETADLSAVPCRATAEDWRRVQKFFDYLEANAGEYWRVPSFGAISGLDVGESPPPAAPDPELPASEEAESDADSELFGAAYEDVVYRDSTDDGMDSSVYEGGQNEALDATHDAIVNRLSF